MNGNENASPTRARRFASSAESATAFVFFVALWFFWGVRYGDFLFVAQENSLFLFRADFFANWQEAPGGLLFYLTAFFIQFFYFPLLGGLILAIFGSALQLATAKLASLRGLGYTLSFLPTCFLTVATTWNAYEIYAPFNPTQPFAPFLGMLAALGVLAVFRKISSARARLIFAVAVGIFAYPGFGFWAPFAVFLLGIEEAANVWVARQAAKTAFKRADALQIGAIFATSVLAPLLWAQFVLYSRVSPQNIFLQGLIDDIRQEKKFPNSTVVYGLTILTPIFWAALLAATKYWNATEPERSARRKAREKAAATEAERAAKIADKREKRASVAAPKKTSKSLFLAENSEMSQKSAKSGAEKREKSEKTKKNVAINLEDAEKLAAKRRNRLVWELALVVWAGTFVAAYRTDAFFNVLASTRAISNGDWERTLELEARLKKPIEQNVAFRNLALFETGRLAEQAFERPVAGAAVSRILPQDVEGAKRGAFFASLFSWLEKQRKATERSAPRALPELIFCHLGATNVAARVATDNFVAAEGRAISFYKTLALCATINGEDRLARRYLNELAQTLFYRDWANVRLAYLETPEFRAGVRDALDDAEYAKAAQDRDAERIRVAAAESVDAAARRYGVAPEAVAAFAAQVEKARIMRPLANKQSAVAYPNATFFLGFVDDEYDDAPEEVKTLILVGALFHKDAKLFLTNVKKYVAARPGEKLPKALEEGLAIWSFAKLGQDWQTKLGVEYEFRPETLEQVGAFIDVLFALRNNPTGEDAQEVIRQFGEGHYWGYAGDESVFN